MANNDIESPDNEIPKQIKKLLLLNSLNRVGESDHNEKMHANSVDN